MVPDNSPDSMRSIKASTVLRMTRCLRDRPAAPFGKRQRLAGAVEGRFLSKFLHVIGVGMLVEEVYTRGDKEWLHLLGAVAIGR